MLVQLDGFIGLGLVQMLQFVFYYRGECRCQRFDLLRPLSDTLGDDLNVAVSDRGMNAVTFFSRLGLALMNLRKAASTEGLTNGELFCENSIIWLATHKEFDHETGRQRIPPERSPELPIF
jgi:hypothetical protein